MAQSRFITPTANIPFDLLAGLIFEEVIASEVHGDNEALVHFHGDAGTVHVYLTGSTPWTFIHEVPPDEVAEIQQTSVFKDALDRCREHFKTTGIVMFVGIDD